MLQQSLESRAKRFESRIRSFSHMRDSRFIVPFFFYTAWRNRYPVMAKVLYRIFVLIEVYALYENGFSDFAFSLAFIFFVSFSFRKIFRGVSQFFRVLLAQARITRSSVRLTDVTGGLLVLSLLYSLITCGSIFVFLMSSSSETSLQIFSGLWFFIFLGELVSDSLWMVIYTRHRLPRNFALITALRALPVLSAFFLTSVTGIWVYILAIFIGRIGEVIHLSTLALRALSKDNIHVFDSHNKKKKTKRISKILLNALRNNEMYTYIECHALPQIYRIMLACFLFQTDLYLWLAYFTFHSMLTSLCYLPTRIASSMGMDLYTRIQKLDLETAQHYLFRTRVVVLCATIMSFALTALALFGDYSYLLLDYKIISQTSLFLLFAIPSFAFYRSEFAYFVALGQEPRVLNIKRLSYISIIAIQAVLVIIFRANLSALLLVEILFHIIVAALMYMKIKPSKSPFYEYSLSYKLMTSSFLPTNIWFEVLRFCKSSAVVIIHLDKNFVNAQGRENSTKHISKSLNTIFASCSLTPDVFLLADIENKFTSSSALEREVILHSGGNIRNVIAVSKDFDIDDIEKILKVNDLHANTKKLALRVIRATEEKELRDLQREYSQFFNSKSLEKNIARYCRKQAFKKVKILTKTGKGDSWFIRSNHRKYANKLFSNSQGVMSLVPQKLQQFPCITVLGKPIVVFDGRKVSGKAKDELRTFCILGSILLTAETFLFHDWQPRIETENVCKKFIEKRKTSIKKTPIKEPSLKQRAVA